MALPKKDSFDADYGGIKADYTQAVDPTTDLPAEASNQFRASVAGMTNLSKRIFIIYTNDGSSAAVINDFDTVVGNESFNYPTFSKIADGHWRLTFQALCLDLLGNTQFWNFRYATGDVFSAATPCKIQCQISAPNIVEVYSWPLTSLVPDDLAGIATLVEIY